MRYISTSAGTFDIHVFANGKVLTTFADGVVLGADTPSAPNCELSGVGKLGSRAGLTKSFEIQVQSLGLSLLFLITSSLITSSHLLYTYHPIGDLPSLVTRCSHCLILSPGAITLIVPSLLLYSRFSSLITPSLTTSFLIHADPLSLWTLVGAAAPATLF